MKTTDEFYTVKSKTEIKFMIRTKRRRLELPGEYFPQFQGFKCAHCRQYVSAEPLFSGVNNRNHCPYCLWSRHLDLHKAGDRLAACKSQMQPVGLALKRVRKKYGLDRGELMLIHRCVECGKVSINRIAADDDPHTMLEIFRHSLNLDGQTRTALQMDDIQALQTTDLELVYARLFGQGDHAPFNN